MRPASVGSVLALVLVGLSAGRARAQIEPTDTLFVFHLASDQVVPAHASPARGGCMAGFDAGASELFITCVHDAADVSAIDIHRGAAGVAGAVVFDLGAPASPVSAT